MKPQPIYPNVTKAQYEADRARHGGYRPGAGPKAREFTDTEMRRIKAMLADKFSYRAIAERFSTYPERISAMAKEIESA